MMQVDEEKKEPAPLVFSQDVREMDMMSAFPCHNGCCMIQREPYVKKVHDSVIRRRMMKAGAFMDDPIEDRVLLVQSRGRLWGCPKGTSNVDESIVHCAIREVKEETGLDIEEKDFKRVIKVQNKAVYYYIERPVCDVQIQNTVPDNDANGICWIKPTCLENGIRNGDISVSQHCRALFRKILKIVLPEHSTQERLRYKSRGLKILSVQIKQR